MKRRLEDIWCVYVALFTFVALHYTPRFESRLFGISGSKAAILLGRKRTNVSLAANIELRR